RSLHDVGSEQLAPHVDHDLAPLPHLRRQEGESDAALEHGREVPARDLADHRAVAHHLLACARRLAAVDLQPAQEPAHARGPLGLARMASAASGLTDASRSRASGPCTAMTARDAVTSRPPSTACTRSVFDALGMTSNCSSSSHHTMMSSSTEPSSSSRCVYCARPGAILRRSFVKPRCSPSNDPSPVTRTVPRWLTSNAAADERQARCSTSVPVG